MKNNPLQVNARQSFQSIHRLVSRFKSLILLLRDQMYLWKSTFTLPSIKDGLQIPYSNQTNSANLTNTKNFASSHGWSDTFFLFFFPRVKTHRSIMVKKWICYITPKLKAVILIWYKFFWPKTLRNISSLRSQTRLNWSNLMKEQKCLHRPQSRWKWMAPATLPPRTTTAAAERRRKKRLFRPCEPRVLQSWWEGTGPTGWTSSTRNATAYRPTLFDFHTNRNEKNYKLKKKKNTNSLHCRTINIFSLIFSESKQKYRNKKSRRSFEVWLRILGFQDFVN